MSVWCSMRIREGMTDEHSDRASVRVVPIIRGQLASTRMPPTDILVLAIDRSRPFQEGVPAQPCGLSTQSQQVPHECGQPSATRRQIPVEPADLIVLTVRIVVAALS